MDLDLAEAKALLESATRPAVQALLRQFIATNTEKELDVVEPMEEEAAAEVTTTAPPPLKASVTAPPPVKLKDGGPTTAQAGMNWVVPTYGWEQGEYNTPWVNVFVSIDDVGAAKNRVTCDFEADSFDLKALDVDGKNFRLKVDALDKDIVPDESKVVVKKDRVTVKLKKTKGEYSYDHWTDLKKKGGKAAKDKEKQRKDDPTAGIMDMMKDLYDTGDDNMRKIIGESMMKSRRGEKMDNPNQLDDPDPPTDWMDSSKMPPFPDV